MEKICRKCGRILPIDNFKEIISSTNGYYRLKTCNECISNAQKEVYRNNPIVSEIFKANRIIKTEQARKVYNQEIITCKKCGKILPKDKFQQRKLKSGVIGYYQSCKICRKKMIDNWRQINEPIKPLITKTCLNCGNIFETKNPIQKICNKLCKPQTELWKDNQYLKEHPEINRKEYFKEKNRKKFWQNAEYRKQLMNDPIRKENYNRTARLGRKKYKQEHPFEFAQRRQKYIKKRLANDIDYRIKKSLQTRITSSINGNKLYNHSIDLLGCSIIDVRKHLEKQFQKGMTWDNWGVFGWHIDHIIPISSFDFTKKEDQYRCWHYTNLQPLWWLDNIMKADKIIEKQLILL
jgi:hypothetical protein